MNSQIPLAERLRPTHFDDYVGQEHLIGKESTLRNVIEKGVIPSMILWGPPGVGKTTLAYLIANHSKRPFYTLSAINSGVKDIREIIDKANNSNLFSNKNPILFIDEIHRFSKSQQDSLLGAVEKGIVTLIGATTENPSFEIISALLSRCQVYILKEQTKDDLTKLLHIALIKDEFLNKKKIHILEYEALLQLSGGDARKLLNTLEIVVSNYETDPIDITNEKVIDIVQQNIVRYDKSGEQHYDIVSAFIKSIRGSDPNAAVYWLARMLEGGEDISFIARRMLILSSEDIGNANPTALVIANNCFQSVGVIGMPEARIILSQTAIYLATSPKSNSSYIAINHALDLVRKTGNLSVPLHLRNAPTKLMKEIGYGENYAYSHNYDKNFSFQEYLPEEISNSILYSPGNNSKEESIRKLLKELWKGKYDY
ncbi:MAG: replication-associated recombination protein A [Flavobacteriales bacterium]|nr:replication-associated recombination protein A [Flavobacteriales bacterium]